MDGQTISEDAAGVAQALELARHKADELGRLVIEVLADGQPAADLLDRLPQDPAGVAELGVTTADKSLFLRETLFDARDALDRTRADQQAAAGLVDSGEVAQALGSLRSIVEGWQLVRSVVDQAATLLDVPLHQLRSNDTPGDEIIRALAGDLVALRDAVSREDWSALSDTLACDLDARAEQWLGLIAALTDRAAGVSTP
jgi:hypothetical protein